MIISMKGMDKMFLTVIDVVFALYEVLKHKIMLCAKKYANIRDKIQEKPRVNFNNLQSS